MKASPLPGLILGFVCAVALGAQDIRVTATRLFPNQGGRVTWGGKNNLLAFDRQGDDGRYDVYSSNPDGSNLVCLTCGATQLPAYNKGNPEWHPANDFLAVQVQWAEPLGGASLAAPGVGVDNDLYIMDAAGKNYWPVTTNASGVLHPRFSHDGTKLLWVQKASFNFWNLMLGDFAVVNGVPQVTGIKSLPPCADRVFCETGGFSSDDASVMFTGTLDGQPESGIDIYSYNLQTETLTRLTETRDAWDEFPTAFPNSKKIVWMSGVLKVFGAGLETDYWMMDEDGSNKVQITFFNDPNAPSWALGYGVSCAKFNWSPDAKQLAAYLIPEGRSLAQSGEIHIIDLEPAAPTLSAASFARPPLAAESIASTFYPGLATVNDAASSSTLPTELGGTTVLVTDSRGSARAAPLFFVSPGQVNWQVPPGTAPGPATVAFTNSQGETSRATIEIGSVGPGIFTAAATGAGPPAGYVLLYHAGLQDAASTTFVYSCPGGGACAAVPVTLGSSSDSAYLILFGTGLRFAGSISVNVGGRNVPVSASGAQGFFDGLDQVNVLLPHSLAGAGLTDISLLVDGVLSNTVEVEIQ